MLLQATVVANTTQVVVSPTVVGVVPEATTSSKVAAAAVRAAGRPTAYPSRPEFAHDLSMNEMAE